MMAEEQLQTVNEMKLCTGCEWTWTRTVLGVEKKSTIDYIIIEEDTASSISKANIDEMKEITPYHGTSKRTYSDTHTRKHVVYHLILLVNLLYT